ncbi:TPR domain containing protein [Fusarium agapanthi]|uniref:TPR domain containing protein n=1 Tax=Fusarium agapanthi TaxID=1803897 RepID=A0A9P5BIL2_9HYPO|nr:TPR domain containing protein [Fusarium agapanthi]
MADSSGPRRYALLVGIDFYLPGNARNMALSNLQGCVNDVKGIHGFLNTAFADEFKTVILTSSPAGPDPKMPLEDPQAWPTFENIKTQFDLVFSNAKEGDVFFFHYSGHGARLPRTMASPNKETDPSLLTIDFCEGGRPVLVVFLDSCYSGGSWREGCRFRTPDTKIKIPNLPSDEVVIEVPIVIAKIEGDRIILPIGQVHGVERHSEFVFCSPPATFISIDDVEPDTCSAKIPSILLSSQRQLYPMKSLPVTPSKWSFGSKTFKFAVDSALGAAFYHAIQHAVQHRIASPLQTFDNIEECDIDVLRLKARRDHVDIIAPESLTGYHGPVRGLSLRIHDPGVIDETVAALTHLGRFGQILNLFDDGVRGNGIVFDISVLKRQTNQGTSGTFTYRFHNKSANTLYVTVLNLGPGFHVKQICPPYDSPKMVHGGGELDFRFTVTLPDKLRDVGANKPRHRDVIRTMITQDKQISWKALELPYIWDAPEVKLHTTDRDIRPLDDTFQHWVHDQELYL